MNQTSKENQDSAAIIERRKFFYRYRENLEKTRLRAHENFDKYLLTIATGTLILSINFTTSKNGMLSSEWLLIAGWVLLVISILSALISFSLGGNAFFLEICRVDRQIRRLNEGKKLKSYPDNKFSKRVNTANWITLYSFTLGLVFLVFFYFINLTN